MLRVLTRLGIPVVLFLAAIFVSWPGIYGDLFFDSIPNIAENKAIQISDLYPSSLISAALSFSEAPIARPLPMLSFALDWYFAGPDPAWAKVENLLIHGLNAVLVFYLILRVLRLYGRLGEQGTSASRPESVAFVAALLWAIAPIHGFTVVYVVQRMVLLAAFFTLAAIHAYLSIREVEGLGSPRRIIVYTLLLGIAAVFSLACKQIAVVIPFYIAVIECFLFRFRGLGSMRRPFVIALWLAVSVPVLAQIVVVWSSPNGVYSGYDLREFGPWERLLTQARVLVLYLRNIIVPDYGQLHFFYDTLPISRSLIDPVTTGLSLALLSVLAGVGILVRRRLPLLGFAIFWFLVGHSLESGVWSLEMVFWHRNYLPSLGPLVAMAAAIVWLTQQKGLAHTAGFGLLAFALGLFAIQSFFIATDWSDRVAIARAEVVKNPNSARANLYYARMAAVVYEQGADPKLLAEAARFFSRSMEEDTRNLLSAFGLLYLAVEHNYGSIADYVGAMKQRAAEQKLELSNVTVFEKLVSLHSRAPDRLSRADVADILQAARSNPHLIPEQRASAAFYDADLLRVNGEPASVFLPLLREAVNTMPEARKFRSILFRALIDLGQIDEAAAMLKTPFSRLDRLKEPVIGEYEVRLRQLIEERQSAGVPAS